MIMRVDNEAPVPGIFRIRDCVAPIPDINWIRERERNGSVRSFVQFIVEGTGITISDDERHLGSVTWLKIVILMNVNSAF